MPEKLIANTLPIAIGGLLRCCLETVRVNTSEVQIGDKITCPHCNDTVVLAENGTWKWDKE